MPAFIDLTGQRFGRWTVLRRDVDYRPGVPTWNCKCECGNERAVRGGILAAGKSRSCGCLNVDVHRQLCIDRNTTHGAAKSPEHRTWVNMIQRCTNPRVPAYSKYGAIGVSVCDRWRDSFEAFLTDMGPKPAPNMTIERIDTDRGYEPENCRWATQKEQQNNRRNNFRLFHDGRSLTLQQWADRTGIDRKTISQRIARGWSVERALTAPAVLGRNQYGGHHGTD